MAKKRAKKVVLKSKKSYNLSSSQLAQLAPKFRINPFALGYTLAILGALYVLVVSIIGSMGYAQGMMEMMQRYHWAYSLTFFGILGSMAYSAICGLISGFLIGWLYNKFG